MLAVNENEEVICIYIKNYSIYNPSGIDLGNMGSFRKKFLDESVLDLKNNLKKVGIDLYIFDGDLIKVFKEIKSKYLSAPGVRGVQRVQIHGRFFGKLHLISQILGENENFATIALV